MRKVLLLCSALSLSLASLPVLADSPVYSTQTTNAGGAQATLIFPADPSTQIRVVNAICSSDLATSVLEFRSGTSAYAVTGSVNNTNIFVDRTNGLAVNSLLVLQTAGGICTTAKVHSAVSSSSTNLWITATNASTMAAGDSVYLLGSATTLSLAAKTNTVYAGEAIFVATRGRPLRVISTGTSYSGLDSVSVHYDP